MLKYFYYSQGTQRYHIELEQLLADFLHVESSIAFGMVCYFLIKEKIRR
jgi:7-keto-8-aminopelargonate synthetase-like enzyme